MSGMCTRCGERPRHVKTWCRECKTAWQRDYRRGVRLRLGPPQPVRDENGCLIWQGCIDRSGYPRVQVGEKNAYAHREAWAKTNGPIPPGMTVDHTCEVKACVEPAHLEVCTRGENTRRYYLRRAFA